MIACRERGFFRFASSERKPGKLRGRIMVAPDASREEIEKTALADADVSRFLGDTPVKKVIIVPKRLVNIVAPAPKA